MPLTYLALGDSYTIGEGVLITETFPYQAMQMLRSKNFEIAAPEIIAKTGWTTDELLDAMEQHQFLLKYDVATLLIGVNNQYRSRSVDNFAEEFEMILKKTIELCNNNARHVFVLSIPDWGKTPFALGKNIEKIEEEINAFNATVKSIAAKYGCNYINITDTQRADANDHLFLAEDNLHPSAMEYAKWALMVSQKISELHFA